MGFVITALAVLVCAVVIYAILAVFMQSGPPRSGQDKDKGP